MPARTDKERRARTERLAPRQLECLRLVPFRSSKQIAIELGLAKSTVDGYIADAVAQLEARDRKHAAELLAEVEAEAPDQIRGDYLRVERAAGPHPFPGTQHDEEVGPLAVAHRLRDVAYGASTEWSPAGFQLPVSTRDRPVNGLSPLGRVGWAIALMIGLVFAMGAFVAAARGLAAIFWETSL